MQYNNALAQEPWESLRDISIPPPAYHDKEGWQQRLNKLREALRQPAPASGEIGELVKRLRNINHMSVEECFLDSHLFAKAADMLERLAAQPTQQPDDHVERVANAICGADLDHPYPENYWDHLARAAIAAMPSGEVGQWLPIDSAPRDTPVLLARQMVWNADEGPKWNITVGYWDAEFEHDNDEYRGAWTDDTVASWAYEERTELTPTHWMPLPTPPAQGETAILRSGDARG